MLGAAFETLMPRITLWTPFYDWIAVTHQLRFGAALDADMRHLGFLEIAVDPVTVIAAFIRAWFAA
jgi:hypothetical protein